MSPLRVVAKAGAGAVPVQEIREPLGPVQQQRGHVTVAVDALVFLAGAVPEVAPAPHALGDAVAVAVDLLVEPDVRERCHLGEDLPDRREARRAVPPSAPKLTLIQADEGPQAAVGVPEVDRVDGPPALVLWVGQRSAIQSIIHSLLPPMKVAYISRLGMSPLFAFVQELVAVVVHVAPQRKPTRVVTLL